MRIGYQGTLGSFSWTAAKKLYPNDELINFLTFKDVTDNVLNGNLDFGIIPVENSYTGEVGMVLDELFHSNVYITQMYNLPIIQNLIGLKEAKISDIKHVYSHEQALMQCSNILKELGVELISFSNTALASQYIKEQNDITKASVASKLTADIFGLKILKEEINNNKANTTKFAVISKEIKEVKNHFAFIFTTLDTSGALANVLTEISKHNVNLTSIKSRATHAVAWKYFFYCEAEGSLENSNVKEMINVLCRMCETFKIIGSY